MQLEDKRQIVTKPTYDVVVVGGGIAGVAASVSAARHGAKTLLIEKQINLGGLATMGLINWYEPLCDGEGTQVIFGIAEELIKLSVKYGYENLPAKWGGEGKNAIHYDRYATAYSPTLFSIAMDDYVRSNGVDIRFDTRATYPVIENGHCDGVMVESVSGKEFYPCKCVIDTTGDAGVVAAAGLPTVCGTNYHIYSCHVYYNRDLAAFVQTNDATKFRKWAARGGGMDGKNQPEGMEPMVEYNSDTENEFIKWGKNMIFNLFKDSKKDERDIMMLPTMPQYRKIRRIVGETTFDASATTCADSIGTTGDFRHPGPVYELPYSALYNNAVDNLLTAGRVISADGEGWEIVRVIPVCALTGEAAGIAAAQVAKDNIKVSEVDPATIRHAIKPQ